MRGKGVNNLFAEGVVAEYLYYLDLEETSDLKKDEPRWFGGNKPLIDVTGAGLRVDAKVAFREYVHLSDGRFVEAVGFMGANREVQARDGVTQYGLVEVDMPGRFRRRGSKCVYTAVWTASRHHLEAAPLLQTTTGRCALSRLAAFTQDLADEENFNHDEHKEDNEHKRRGIDDSDH